MEAQRLQVTARAATSTDRSRSHAALQCPRTPTFLKPDHLAWSGRSDGCRNMNSPNGGWP